MDVLNLLATEFALSTEDMKSIWAQMLALSAMAALAAGPIGPGIIDPSSFLSTVQVEWPVARTHSNHLNAHLYPTIQPSLTSDIRQFDLSSLNQKINGKLINTSTNSAAQFPNINVGSDAYNKITDQDLAANDAKNVIYRIPYENLTPYVYGGAAYKFDNKFDNLRPQYSQMGAGAEYHILDNLGLYFDGRYVFKDETQRSAVARAGLRFSF